LTKNSESHAGK